MNELEPGDELEVIAQSPGAPTDLPAWCRMTGNVLRRAEQPAAATVAASAGSSHG